MDKPNFNLRALTQRVRRMFLLLIISTFRLVYFWGRGRSGAEWLVVVGGGWPATAQPQSRSGSKRVVAPVVGHHPAMDDDIDGDEGDADLHVVRARPSRYNKAVSMVGAITLFVFVVTDDKHYKPLWQKWKHGVVGDLANEFANQARDGPRILGFSVGRYEFMPLPLDAADNDKFSILRKASFTASKRRLGELRGWLIWRAFCWIFTDDELVEKAHGPPHPVLLIHSGVAGAIPFSIVLYMYCLICVPLTKQRPHPPKNKQTNKPTTTPTSRSITSGGEHQRHVAYLG